MKDSFFICMQIKASICFPIRSTCCPTIPCFLIQLIFLCSKWFLCIACLKAKRHVFAFLRYFSLQSFNNFQCFRLMLFHTYCISIHRAFTLIFNDLRIKTGIVIRIGGRMFFIMGILMVGGIQRFVFFW